VVGKGILVFEGRMEEEELGKELDETRRRFSELLI
jgi:hypothetical protein